MRRLGLPAVFLLGCATIEPKAPVVSDAPLRTAQAEVVRKEGAHGVLQQDGTKITLTASRSCDVIERPTVLRTTQTEYENKSATVDWLAAGSGVALAGLGVVTVVDAADVGTTDKSSQTYNPIGSGGATAIGISAVAAGAALMAIPVVDFVRGRKIDVEKQEVTSNGATLKRAVACSKEPYAHGVVVAKNVQPFKLGETNEAGQLTADIDAVIDPVWVVPSLAKTLPVFVEDVEVGSIRLADIYKIREDRAFPRNAIAACSSPSVSSACAPFQSFLRSYPDGEHAAEARKLLDEAAPKLQRLRDEESWEAKKVKADACATTKFDNPEDIDAACNVVQQYMSEFPAGLHVKEAEAAIKKGRARSAVLSAEIERRRKAAEEAERRREAAEAAREKAQRMQQCRSACLMRCSHARNEGSCLAGCLGLCEQVQP